ncbi:exodeoxyribonuclease V subunit gamma [Gordonia desulfuricans]|uniref:RecBCD enzyme subunit RecC n=1 Tax=Gordonia desulfuricans TaxID=89051 RepID=A0A7K3LLG3_9ACTN|nr:exodeoxyribonuclease V subunit gamma [Gordonia desulfuricans]NDK89003.1 exodeoxyribonuclease V subunit gamma [Gordonia desulfuricans]
MFVLHRAERTDTLADALGDILLVPLDDPLATEIVAVPARGVERWLQQRLATRLGAGPGGDGIAANIDFSSPAAVTDRVVEQVLAADPGYAADRASAWGANALVWSVLAVLDELITHPALRMLARHIGVGGADPGGSATPATGAADDLRAGRRYATARHIADLFERYARQRPGMLTGWARGDEGDGAGGALPADMAWQPLVWREVRARIGVPHPVEALDDVCARLRADADVIDLPPRSAVFGPTRLTESFRRVAAAVSTHRDVHLFIPHASPALWDVLAGSTHPADPRRAAHTAPALRNPLLAGLSHDIRELQINLQPMVHADLHHEGAASTPTDTPTLLQRVQRGIRDDTAPRDRPAPAAADTSVEIHACHGPERQVEVLRDRLLHLFDADPTLAPRDVIVMCPDVETFAPLIRGSFGQSGLDHPAARLRVRLADRGLRHVNPVLDVVATVVELAVGRVTASEVADLLSRPPVRYRFAMSDDDLEWIREWLSRSGIRWGIDDTQRSRFELAGFAQGTFDAGLDRIALGAVAEEDDGEWLGTALPIEGLESTQIDLAGRLMEFVDRLGDLLTRLTGTHPATVWAQTLIGIVDDLVDTATGDEWQVAQTVRMITEALGSGDPTRPLRLSDVRDLVALMIAGRPTRANFRTGELTVCTLVPMRSVPHRVVVLLGIDAESFPRALRVDGDDVLGRVPLVGERNPRDEDRQLFLDAIMAAEEHLLVCYTGADPVSGTPVPPAVVVSELADTLAALRATDADEVIIRHTLHGFDTRNFVPGAVAGIAGPFGFDTGLLDGARALRGPQTPAVRIADAVIAPATSPGAADPGADPDTDIELTSLISFFTNPIEGFVRQRLGARMPDDETADEDGLDVTLGGLAEWAIGNRLLHRTLAGADLRDCLMAELRRGTLPPAEFGRRDLERISGQVRAVGSTAASLRRDAGATRDFVLELPGGRRLHGSVGDVFGTSVVEATYSKIRPKQRLALWIRLLALTAAAQSGAAAGPVPTAGIVVGRAPQRAPGVSSVHLRAPDDAMTLLADLVEIRRLGLLEVLPLPLDAGEVYGSRLADGSSPSIALRAAAQRFDNMYGDTTDPYIRYVFGNDVTAPVGFDAVTVATVTDESPWATMGLQVGEKLFGALAQRLWTPIVEHEVTPR